MSFACLACLLWCSHFLEMQPANKLAVSVEQTIILIFIMVRFKFVLLFVENSDYAIKQNLKEHRMNGA
jgi:hypothetical protein